MNQIIDLFPNECLETSYVKPIPKKLCRKKKGQVSKGKLVDKWKNRWAFIRASEEAILKQGQVLPQRTDNTGKIYRKFSKQLQLLLYKINTCFNGFNRFKFS